MLINAILLNHKLIHVTPSSSPVLRVPHHRNAIPVVRVGMDLN